MGKISFTTDVWSDPNMTSFMAITAHWIEGTNVKTMTGMQKKLELRTDLVGFQSPRETHRETSSSLLSVHHR